MRRRAAAAAARRCARARAPQLALVRPASRLLRRTAPVVAARAHAPPPSLPPRSEKQKAEQKALKEAAAKMKGGKK